MKRAFQSLKEVYAHGADDVIDVRSPAEFAIDHWPGAINLPVLDDAERARVGTIYKQVSPFQARVTGAALVAANAARHLQGPLADKPGGWRPLVYCWRGGQRSGSFASILEQIGWRVELVEGGYQSYRRLVVGLLHGAELAQRLVLLDGNTGTAKTELLGLLAERGLQMLDLEGLAAHRGSVFGETDRPQPSQRAFESALARAITGFDPARPVVVEAESSRIGGLTIPPALWEAMKVAPRIAVAAPVAARADYLVRTYGDALGDPERLDAVLARLVRYHGRERVAEWRQMAAAGDHAGLASDLIERHYDPGYARSRQGRTEAVRVVQAPGLGPGDLDQLAGQVAKTVAALDG